VIENNQTDNFDNKSNPSNNIIALQSKNEKIIEEFNNLIKAQNLTKL